MNRREMLALGMGLTGLAISRSWIRSAGLVTSALSADPDPLESLRNIASAQGVVFGAAVPKEQLIANRYFAGITAQQCGILVPEVELKWKALRPTPDQYDFSGADWLLDFAKAHQMLFRGHTLVWEQALPNWF